MTLREIFEKRLAEAALSVEFEIDEAKLADAIASRMEQLRAEVAQITGRILSRPNGEPQG